MTIPLIASLYASLLPFFLVASESKVPVKVVNKDFCVSEVVESCRRPLSDRFLKPLYRYEITSYNYIVTFLLRGQCYA